MAAKLKIEKRGDEILMLNIEQFWPFEEMYIFSNSGHLEWRAGLPDTFLKGSHPGTIPLLYIKPECVQI
jgi:hypothetical protein